MPKEIPLLFSTEMVRAILDGRKTQTRRVVKGMALDWLDGFTPEFVADPGNSKLCPYGQPGDVIWVRENWAARDCDTTTGIVKIEFEASPGQYYKKALKRSVMILHAPMGEKKKWKPSIHLQKDAARIWLEIEGIRIERLQDISEEDCIAEGIEKTDSLIRGWNYKNYLQNSFQDIGPDGSFETLWESINGHESWEANPWVWVVKFNVLSTTGRPESIQ